MITSSPLNLAISLQLVENPLRQTCYYKSTFESHYQPLEGTFQRFYRSALKSKFFAKLEDL